MLTLTVCCTLWYFFLPLINPSRPHSTIPSYKIDSCDVPSGFPNSLNCETLDQYLSDFNMHAKSWRILFNMQSLGWSVSGVKRRLSKHRALSSTPSRNQTATIKSPPPCYPSWLMTPLLSKPDCLLWKLFLSPKDVKPKVSPCEQHTTEKEKKPNNIGNEADKPPCRRCPRVWACSKTSKKKDYLELMKLVLLSLCIVRIPETRVTLAAPPQTLRSYLLPSYLPVWKFLSVLARAGPLMCKWSST